MTPNQVSAQLLAQELSKYSLSFFKECIQSWQSIPFSLSEPKMIEKYLLEAGVGVDYLNQNFAKSFSAKNSRFEMKFSSIFIHGRPMVLRHVDHTNNPHSKSCEIGDVCLIYLRLDKQKNIREARSMIAQAKKSKKLDSEDQQLLYDSAGGFDYKHKTFFGKTFNKISSRYLPGYEEGRPLGLKFLILNPSKSNPSGTNAVLHSPPWESDLYHTWGASLFRMATGCDGLGFEPGKPNASHWSAILDDLIKMAKGTIASSSKSSKRRGNLNELDEIVDEFNHFTNYEKWNIQGNNEVPEGVSIILMIVQDTELYEAQ